MTSWMLIAFCSRVKALPDLAASIPSTNFWAPLLFIVNNCLISNEISFHYLHQFGGNLLLSDFFPAILAIFDKHHTPMHILKWPDITICAVAGTHRWKPDFLIGRKQLDSFNKGSPSFKKDLHTVKTESDSPLCVHSRSGQHHFLLL